MPPPRSAARPGRRQVLLGLLATGLGTTWLGGCTLSDPAVRGGLSPTPRTSGGSPTPSPTPTTGRAADVAAELALAVAAEQLRERLRAAEEPDRRRVALLAVVAAAHRERAAALADPDPGSRPTPTDPSAAPSPSPTASSTPAPTPTLARLARLERERAAAYREATPAATGPEALLLGSMAAASESFARALTAERAPTATPPAPHLVPEVPSDTVAVAELVGALHAAVYGYQRALGPLTSGSARERGLAGLAERRRLRDALVTRLLAAGVEVPAPAAVYDTGSGPDDTGPDDAAPAGRLLRRVETGLLPWVGRWLAAAARPADRRDALTALTDTAARAVAWGAPVTAWPGWPD